jgi:hypothetical protein
MKEVLIIIAGILSVVSSLPYIIDTAKGKTHPNLVTWFTWTVLVAINVSVAATAGAHQTAIMSGAVLFADLAILGMGIKKGVKKYTAFDALCQALALVGIILWRLTGDPSLATILSLFAFLIAALPTWRHAWVAPFAETWEGFALAVASGILTIFSLSKYTFIALAFPTITIVIGTVMVGIILLRRRQAEVPAEQGIHEKKTAHA